MTGTGTQTDPYIVNDWIEFESVVSTSCYIKWEANLIIDSLTLPHASSGTQKSATGGWSVNTSKFYFEWRANVDFNGLKITNLIIDPKGATSKSYDYTYFLMYRESNITIKNLELTNVVSEGRRKFLSVRAPNSILSLQVLFQNVHILNSGTVECDDYVVPVIYAGRSCHYEVTFKKCVINFTNKIDNKLLFSSCFENCEINITTPQLLHDIPSSSPLYQKQFKNCMITFNLDTTHSSLVFCPHSTQSSTGNSFLMSNCILRFNLISNISDFSLTLQSIGGIENDSGVLLITGDTGYPITFVDGIYFTCSDVVVTTEFIKSIGRLSQRGFKVYVDSGIRYAEFNNTDDENWSMRMNAEINNGIPFLPFWIYGTTGGGGEIISNLYMGNKQITSIYYGNKPIVVVYYGNKQIYLNDNK